MPAGGLLGRIFPMPDGRPGDAPWKTEVGAVLWDHEGRVAFAGDAAVARLRAPGLGITPSALRELPAGSFAVPGFVDAHMHLLSVGLKRGRPDLGGAASLEEAMRLLSDWLRSHPGDTPVVAEKWDESSWPGRARPTRHDLDQAAALAGQPGRPIVARRVCGHIAIASTSALPAVQARWSDPSLVDAATGTLLEAPSLYLNEALPASAAQLREAVDAACQEALRLGVTTVGDYAQAPYREAHLEAAREGRLRVRIVCSVYPQQLADEVRSGFRTGRPAPGPGGSPSPFLQDGGLKVFLDGSLGARTAALRGRYLDAPAGTPEDCPPPAGPHGASRHGCVGHAHVRGTLNWGDGDVGRLFRTAIEAGIQVHAHAIGDAAIDQGLDAYATVDKSLPGAVRRLRCRFEHFEIAHDEQVAACVQLGVVASSQPNFVGVWSSKGGMYEERLGASFLLNNRFRAFTGAGLEVAFGSDGMPFGPLEGIAAAATHPDATQRLDPLEAVWHYTNRAAWALHHSGTGSLVPGSWADLVVLEGSPEERRGSAPRWSVEETLVAGQGAFPVQPSMRPI